jgi:arginase
MKHKFKYIGAAIGECAATLGAEKAPDVIKAKLHLVDNWQTTIYCNARQKPPALDEVASFSVKLANVTAEVLSAGYKFITFGGDHSCAIGTWSGVAKLHQEFGVIWIDAHMDAHTHETTLTGNIHGMPVASLLGVGAGALQNIVFTGPKIKPENIVLIGIRSYEAEEKKLLETLGVKIFMMSEVSKIGFAACMNYAIEKFAAKNIQYGISFDVDGLDPKYLTATGTMEQNGIDLQQVCSAFNKINLDDLIGLELVEYNPDLDNENCSDIATIKQILDSLPKR